ncbi:unnamed protein product [Hymenolepis diminuta]|uniref:EF-hand domain-containing protein n=1 Tax=Hymenolepis diminuta TaxID=6216 RepID=A0A564YRF6_HYMDI|nr:unnamed protein product [Hymenolepis diminuta]
MPARNKGVKGLFEKIDQDGSEKIDCGELRRALGEDNINERLIEKLFLKYDKNRDGFLDRKELLEFFKQNSIYLSLCQENLK